jgi:2-polyprenyl-3-methyl-5-hydroxy-6-metoxy-1,4-benzoquinol methylase
MNQNDDLKKTYNRIARDWSTQHGVDDWWIEGTDTFLSLLPKGATILDVGCGSGYKTKYIKDKGFNAAGIDFSEEMIKFAKEKYTDVDFEVVDVYDLDKYPKTFDGIYSQAVFLHIPKKRSIEVLEKMKSRLNDGGLLHLALKEVKDKKVEEEIKKENDFGYEFERLFVYYTLDELRGYFMSLGFEMVSEKIVVSGRAKWINIVGKKI